MMLKLKKVFVFLILVILTAACEQEGVMERAGKATDEAIEDAGEAIEDAQEKVEDAIEEKHKKKSIVHCYTDTLERGRNEKTRRLLY